MNKSFVKFCLLIYSKIRKLAEKVMFNMFGQKTEKNGKWEEVKNLGIYDFETVINRYPYKPDPLGGALDISFPESNPDYFFSELDYGRDCDDYARIAALYLLYHCDLYDEIKEVIVLDYDKPFKSAHVVTTYRSKASGKYYLFNYWVSGPYDTFDETVKGCITHSTTSYKYKEDKFIYKVYKEYGEKK